MLMQDIEVKVYRSRVKIPVIFFVPAAFLTSVYVLLYLLLNSNFFLKTVVAKANGALPGRVNVTELQVEPTLLRFHIYETTLHAATGAEVVRAQEIHAAVNPLLLLARRLQVEDILVRHLGVRIWMPDDYDPLTDLDLLEALGLVGNDKEESAGPSLLAGISLKDIRCEACTVSYEMDFMRVDVPDLNIPDGEVHIGDTLVMKVPNLQVDRIFLKFRPYLFRFYEDQGDWDVVLHDISLKNWHWNNEGFNVERLSLEANGIRATASGDMRFPDVAPGERTVMLYRAEGEVDIAVWNQSIHYFVDDLVHADLHTKIAVEGTLEEIVGEFELYAPYLETQGLRATEVRGRGRLDDDVVTFDEASADVHGGRVEIQQFFYSMFTGIYGGDFTVDDVDPAGMLTDFGFDYPWLAGRARGDFTVMGFIPYSPFFKPGRDPYGWIAEATAPIAWLKLNKDLSVSRDTSGVLPGSRIRLGGGASLWASRDSIGIPKLSLFLDSASVRISDFYLNWVTNHLVSWMNSPWTTIAIDAPDLGALAGSYGVAGLGGSVRAKLMARGRLNYPDVEWSLTVDRPSLSLGAEIVGVSLEGRGRLLKGRLELPSVKLATVEGALAVDGWIDVLRDPVNILDPETGQPVRDYLVFRRNQAQLAFDAHDVDMRIFSAVLPDTVGPRGRAYVKGELSRSLQDPRVDLDVRIDQGEFFGQPLRKMAFTGTFSEQSARVEKALIDAGVAGRIEGVGSYDLNQDIVSFDLTGTKLDLDRVVAVREASPYAIEGIGEFRLEGSGSPLQPHVGGYVTLERLAVDGRAIGNLTLVANTLEDTIHFVGALLPWISVDLEVPMDEESPFYMRLGLDHIQVSDAIEEIKDNKILDEIEATGMVEVYLEKDFSRYQVLADLSDIQLTTLGRTFSNRGPVVVGLNDGELLQLQQATVGADGRFVSVQGGLFLDQALLDLSIVGDLDLALINSVRVTFPQYFPDWLVEAKGVLTLDTNLRGTPGQLTADGFMSFSPTELQLRDLSDPVLVTSGLVRFNEAGLRIDPKSPIVGQALQGNYELRGEVGFVGFKPEDFRIQIKAENMSYRLPDVANLTFGAGLEIEAGDVHRPETWKVTGDIDVVDGRYYENISIFKEQFTNRLLGAFSRSTKTYQASIIERFSMLEEVQFDVNLRARDGFRIQSEIDRLAMDLELRVDVAFRNTLVAPQVIGDVDVIDGRVAFQGEKFEVRTGSLSFLGSPDNPELDIIAFADVANRCREPDLGDEARTPLTLTGTVGNSEQRVFAVTLNVRGRLDNLNVQFESNPYADQRDILSLILTGCTVDQLTASSATSPTLEVALAPVLGWIEGTVEDAVAVEEFTITPSVDRLRTSIGDRLSRRLSWRLQVDTGLAEPTGGQRAQLKYKLSDEWSAQMSESSRTEDETFVFDFKLRYRYFLD